MAFSIARTRIFRTKNLFLSLPIFCCFLALPLAGAPRFEIPPGAMESNPGQAPISEIEKSSGNLHDTVAPPERRDVFTLGLRELARAKTEIERNPESLEPHFNRLRLLYVLGVKEEPYLDQGDAEIHVIKRLMEKCVAVGIADKMKDAEVGVDSKGVENLLLAYSGALRVGHAKHGFNLKKKWRQLESGLPILDSAVARNPNQPELRYLRLVSNYYLPFFLGRKPLVRDDFSALARLLPQASEQYPPKWFLSVAGFVLDKGQLDDKQKMELARRVQAVSQLVNDQNNPAREDG